MYMFFVFWIYCSRKSVLSEAVSHVICKHPQPPLMLYRRVSTCSRKRMNSSCKNYVSSEIVRNKMVQCNETWRVFPRVRRTFLALTACRSLILNEHNTNIICMYVCMYIFVYICMYVYMFVYGVWLEFTNWFDPSWHRYPRHFCVGWGLLEAAGPG